MIAEKEVTSNQKQDTRQPKLIHQINPADYTVLIVDDNAINLGVIADYLEAYSFQLLVARNGNKALESAQYAQPDIILLDVMMPGIDGFETCRQLKANEITKDIPVIFMTALASTEDKVRGFEVGGVDYVTKPIQQAEVLARITTHLQIRNLTQNLQQANTELTKLNATKDKFFSIVAHDLKGPFNPLLGTAELLSELAYEFSRDQIKESSDSLYRSAKTVHTLLDNLLHWSRLQMNRIKYQPEQVELKTVAEQCVNLLATNVSIKDIDMKNEIPDDLFVYADKNMLDTIIRNLASNAVKFTPKGGQVKLSAHPNGGPTVQVSVSDTGVGMSWEDVNKLFRLEVHHTTKGTAEEQGTGLGLIICEDMIKQHGGDIWVDSELKKGTAIHFTIPAWNSKNGDA